LATSMGDTSSSSRAMPGQETSGRGNLLKEL
jgi:hypothetical protein